jgi:acyl-CoA synthetase (AMP-forming)/AMP-acid ligase II
MTWQTIPQMVLGAGDRSGDAEAVVDGPLRLYSEWCDLADLRRGDRYMIVNPFFHIFGYKAGCIASMIGGATVYPVPVFDVERVLELIQRERITMLPGPPTLYHSLLQARARGEWDLSSLRTAVTGAADIPVELIGRVVTELPFEKIMTGYGLTEAGTATASRPGDSLEDIATTVGRPCDGVEVAVIGVPDERMGQVGKALVVRRGEVTAEELIAWSRDRMAGFKVPRHVEFLEELPLNDTGKVVKDRLR